VEAGPREEMAAFAGGAWWGIGNRRGADRAPPRYTGDPRSGARCGGVWARSVRPRESAAVALPPGSRHGS